MMRRWLGLAGLSAALSLSACAVPLEQGYAPGAGLPPPQQAKPLDAYAWLDRADALLDAIADAPPDYSFDHRGEQLFAWDVDEVLIVEEADAKGYALYLFERGESAPFFIRTPDISAGFDRGDLAVVYTRDGDLFIGPDLWRNASSAPAFYQRGVEVRRAAERSRWDAQAARAWAGVETVAIETRDGWDDGWRADRAYTDYRRRSEAEASRAALEDERRRRREARDDFRRWRDGGFAGALPPGARRPDRGDRPDRPGNRDDRVDRPDRGNRPDRPRDRAERPDRPIRPGDAPAPPVIEVPEQPAARPPVLERPLEPVETVIAPETEPEYRRAPLNRPVRPRLDAAPPPDSGRALIPVSDLFRDEEERRRTDAAEAERVTREQEAALQAMREAQAEEARQDEERRAAQERERQADAADADRRATERASANEAARQEPEAPAEARRREAEAAEDAQRRAEQEAAEARARTEERRRGMEPTLQPH